jgi:hypothetical protein
MTRVPDKQRTLKASRTSREELSRPARVTGELEREGTRSKRKRGGTENPIGSKAK